VPIGHDFCFEPAHEGRRHEDEATWPPSRPTPQLPAPQSAPDYLAVVCAASTAIRFRSRTWRHGGGGRRDGTQRGLGRVGEGEGGGGKTREIDTFVGVLCANNINREIGTGGKGGGGCTDRSSSASPHSPRSAADP